MRLLRLALRWLVPALGAAVAIGVLFWLYRDLDFDRFVTGLTTAEPLWLSALAGTILAEQLLRGWKWRQILYDLKPISSWRLFGAILAGYGVGTLIPLGVSPLVRSWLIARLEDLRLASVLVTAAIERFIDGIVFAIIVGAVALADQVPDIEGGLRSGLAVAGALNLALFGALLWLLFSARKSLDRGDAPISRGLDWLASKGGGRLAGIRSAIAEGIVWPRARLRRWGVIGASLGMKAIAASHFLWAGLAIGVVLRPFDYLFLLVFAGFTLVLARFVRVPGGFVIGAGFALNILGVADEAALAMILFNNAFSILLMVGIGLMVFWRSNVELGTLTRSARLIGR
jgi:hypothetical protein